MNYPPETRTLVDSPASDTDFDNFHGKCREHLS